MGKATVLGHDEHDRGDESKTGPQVGGDSTFGYPTVD